MNQDGIPPCCSSWRKFLCCVLVLTLASIAITIIVYYFFDVTPPDFQVDSVSFSVDDNNVAKWDISFSVTNGDIFTLHYRKIEVSVGGRRPLSSTTASIAPLSEHGFFGVKSRNATVYVALPSPRPAIIVDGSEFNIWFQSEYEYKPTIWKKKKGTAVAVCGDNYVRLRTSNGMVGKPMICYS